MRRMNGRSVAVTLAGTAAIATAATSTAYACNTTEASTVSPLQATTLDYRVPLNADVYHAYLDRKLDVLAATADAIAAKVAAIPSDTVLRGTARKTAYAWLAKASGLSRLLDAFPDSGTYAPTAAEAAQVDAIQADLAAITAKVKALLANAPVAVTPTTVKRTDVRQVRVDRDAVRWAWWTWRDGDHHCDGTRDGSRFHH